MTYSRTRNKLIDGQMGVAICTPIVSIPPRDVLVAFEKPFEDRKRGIAFRSGCCWGMRTITPDDFLKGANRAREIRGWPALKDPMGSFFGPQDQARETSKATKKRG